MPRRSGLRTVRPERYPSTKSPRPVTAVCFQADAYGGYRALYESGRITEAACMAPRPEKIHDVHARASTYITTEAPAAYRRTVRHRGRGPGLFSRTASGGKKARAAPLMQSLYDWIQQQMKTLSRHSDTAKAFAYLLKQDALNVYRQQWLGGNRQQHRRERLIGSGRRPEN